MKKILYIAAAVAAIVACSKEVKTTTPEIDSPNAFVEGQKVTLTVNTGNQTKVSSELVTSGVDKDKVNFKWETGDKIKVTVGGKSSEFTLKSGAGSATATFEGTMPADGTTFDVQYPLTDPDLTTQTYSATEAIPHDMMKFTATGCTVGKPFTLTAANAVLRLNLYGTACKVKQIVVTNTSSNPQPSYTLSISPAATICNDSSTPTPFFIIVPAGASSWDFDTVVSGESTATELPKYPSDTDPNYGSGIPITASSCSTTSPKTFTAGECLNMAALAVNTTVWAPVNCGYDATNYRYGKLYQWGRAVGGGYNDGSAFTEDVYQITETIASVSEVANTDPADNVFYLGLVTSSYDWYIKDDGVRLSSWPMKSGDAGYVAGKIANPCPDGWRVPTYDELKALFGGNSSPVFTTVEGQDGCYFNGSNSASGGVFLPAAGHRSASDGTVSKRSNEGRYWSSSVNRSSAWHLCLIRPEPITEASESAIDGWNRANGCSVRCVKE